MVARLFLYYGNHLDRFRGENQNIDTKVSLNMLFLAYDPYQCSACRIILLYSPFLCHVTGGFNKAFLLLVKDIENSILK